MTAEFHGPRGTGHAPSVVGPHASLNWWDKPRLYAWDGTLILLRVQMWCDLCWAACMDGADQAEAVDGQRTRELQAEAAEWREAYRVVAEVVKPRAKRA